MVAHALDLFLLHAEGGCEVAFRGHFHVGLALALFVLERGVEQDDARVLDRALHLRVRHVLVEHDAVQHAAVLERAARDLLDLRVALDVDLDPAAALLLRAHALHRVNREFRDELAPLRHELRADAGAHYFINELLVLLGVDGGGDLARDLGRLLERGVVRVHDDGGVDLALQKLLGRRQDLGRQDDHGRRPVAHLLVLSPRDLDHALRGGVRHVDLSRSPQLSLPRAGWRCRRS